MMTNNLICHLLFCCLTFSACVRPQTPAKPAQSVSTPRETPNRQQLQVPQTSFGLEEKVDAPVIIPEDVLDLLRASEAARKALQRGQSEKEIAASWFVASEIDLNEDAQPDLIVQPVNVRLLGANVAPFWVFHKTPDGHKVVLNAHALGLEILKEKSGSFREIRIMRATADEVVSTIYKFEGTQYKISHSSTEKIVAKRGEVE